MHKDMTFTGARHGIRRYRTIILSEKDLIFCGSWNSAYDKSAVIAQRRINPRVSTAPLDGINAVLVFLAYTNHAISQYTVLCPATHHMHHLLLCQFKFITNWLEISPPCGLFLNGGCSQHVYQRSKSNRLFESVN